MAKRRADKELNHDNWNDDYEKEEAGTFQRATAESIKGRVVRKAKRRIARTEEDSPKNVFTGFSSLVNTKMPEADFSFLKKFQTKPSSGEDKEIVMTSISLTSPTITKSAFSTPTADNEVKSTFSTGTSVSANETSFTHKVSDNVANKKYEDLLAALNASFLAWVKQHIDKDPVCILTPTLRDYEKHLAEIQDAKKQSIKQDSDDSLKPKPFKFETTDSKNENKTEKTFKFGESSTSSTNKNFKFGLHATGDFATSEKNVTFKFGSNNDQKNEVAKPTVSFSTDNLKTNETKSTFSFGSDAKDGTTKAPFSFTSTKTSSAGSSTPAFTGFSFIPPPKKAENSPTKEDADEDEPPKVQINQVKEEDAIYSIRCKLFFKKDGQYKEKGVGMLYLKPVSGGKTQLIIRADTNLGNILLNILLQPSLPLQRVGKNNVMLVCIPNPPLNPKEVDETPVPMLVRVKTETEADELLEKLTDLKKNE